VDDKTVYTKLKDFQNADAKKLYKQYAGWQKELTDTNTKLVERRKAYFEASSKKRLTMTKPILELEKKRSELQANIDKAAKKIRKLEK
jgi:predicted  nucleic acid-binding Zn-ribbon protein